MSSAIAGTRDDASKRARDRANAAAQTQPQPAPTAPGFTTPTTTDQDDQVAAGKDDIQALIRALASHEWQSPQVQKAIIQGLSQFKDPQV